MQKKIKINYFIQQHLTDYLSKNNNIKIPTNKKDYIGEVSKDIQIIFFEKIESLLESKSQEQKTNIINSIIASYFEISDLFDLSFKDINDSSNKNEIIENFANHIKKKIKESLALQTDELQTEESKNKKLESAKLIVNLYLEKNEKISIVLEKIQNEKQKKLNTSSLNNLKIDIQDLEKNDYSEQKIKNLFDLYSKIEKMIEVCKQKTLDQGIKCSEKQKKQLARKFKIFLSEDEIQENDNNKKFNKILKETFKNFSISQSEHNAQNENEKNPSNSQIKKKTNKLNIKYKIAYLLQAVCSIFFIQETIYQTSRILRNKDNNPLEYTQASIQALLYINLAITNGIRALCGLLGENVNFAYFHNYIPAKIANFFTKKGKESNSICNILKYCSILMVFQAIAAELSYGTIGSEINSKYQNSFQNNTIGHNNFANQVQAGNIFSKYFMESLNFAWYLIIDVNICVFARSLIEPYINKKFFSHEFPFFKVSIDGRDIFVTNHEYEKNRGNQYCNYSNIENGDKFLDLKKKYTDQKTTDLKTKASTLFKEGKFEPYSPDLKSRNFTKKSLLIRHFLFAFSACIVPFLEHIMFEKSKSNFAQSFIAAFGEIFCLYGAGFAAISDLYLQFISNTKLHEHAHKANSLGKMFYIGIINTCSILCYGMNRFFFNSEIFILSTHLMKNNVSKRSIANFLTAGGIFFENIHFGFLIKNLNDFKESISNNDLNKINETNVHIKKLYKMQATNDKLMNFNICFNVANILIEFCKIAYMSQLNDIKKFDLNHFAQFAFLAKNIFMGPIMANFHFFYGSKSKIINNKIEESINILEKKKYELTEEIIEELIALCKNDKALNLKKFTISYVNENQNITISQ